MNVKRVRIEVKGEPEIIIFGVKSNEVSPAYTENAMDTEIESELSGIVDPEDYTSYAGGLCAEDLNNEFGAERGALIDYYIWQWIKIMQIMPHIRIFVKNLP